MSPPYTYSYIANEGSIEIFVALASNKALRVLAFDKIFIKL